MDTPTAEEIEVDRRLVNRPIILWPHSWMRNQEMRGCSIAARGLFIDLMVIAWKGVPYGSLTSDTGPLSEEVIASTCGIKAKEVRAGIQELVKRKRLVMNLDGSLSIPLMLKSRRQQLRRAARRQAELAKSATVEGDAT